MTDKKNDRNLDPERMERNDESKTTEEKDVNAGGNATEYDGGHPKDSQRDSDGRLKSGEEYARRQHGKDEIEDKSYNAGGNDSDYDGGHPTDSSKDNRGKIDSE